MAPALAGLHDNRNAQSSCTLHGFRGPIQMAVVTMCTFITTIFLQVMIKRRKEELLQELASIKEMPESCDSVWWIE